MSVLTRCLYYGGVHKARFDCSCTVPENIPELLFFDVIEAGIDLWRYQTTSLFLTEQIESD